MAGSEARGGQNWNLAAMFPVVWLVVQLALDAWTVSQSWRSASMQELPGDVANYVYGLLGGAAISLLWGLWVLALAWSDREAFRRHFIVWQVAVILWTLVRQAWVFMIPDMILTPAFFLFPAGEIVIGVIAIALAARRPVPAPPPVALERRSPLTIVLFALGGVVVGAILGAIAGFLVGSGIATLTDMSCFEGQCGYFAAAVGLLGLVLGGVAGGVLAGWRASRRRPAARPPQLQPEPHRHT